MSSAPGPTQPPGLPRRNFIEWREVPRLLLGTARGDPPALRRVLGARRGGRIGSYLDLALLALAAPSARAAAAGVAAYFALAALGALRLRRHGLALYHSLRLLLWQLPGPLLLAGLARLAGASTALPLLLAALGGYLLLQLALRSGLGGTGSSPGLR